MAIILDGTTGITTPDLSIDSNVLSLSTLTATTLKSATSSPPIIQNSSGTVIGTFCRAWVNFNGTGAVAIRASFNVSSITDNGTGNYTVNFTNAMPNTNYAFTYGITRETTGIGDIRLNGQSDSLTVNGFRILSGYGSGTLFDFPNIGLSFFI